MSVKENRDVVSKIIAALNESQAYQESVIRDQVDDWLDDHPEATTTVEDGVISYAKLNSSLKESIDEIEEIPVLKIALTSVGGVHSFAVDSYIPTWNMWDGSWGLSNTNPVTGSTLAYMVYSPVIPVTAGEYYSVGILSNDISPSVPVIAVSWRKEDGTAISVTNVYAQGGYLKWMQAPATAAKAYVYFNTNNASVALDPSDIYTANVKFFFANRLVNFTNRDSAGQYAIKANEWIPSYILGQDAIEHTITHIVTVGALNSMYTSLREAFDDIETYGHASENNRFEVQIKEGTYDISSYYTAEEKTAENFIGLSVPDWVTLKGIGNRDNTVIEYVLSDASSKISVLNLKNTCSLENLTIYGEKTRYTVHDDFANNLGNPYTRYCRNVHFKGDTLTYGAVYGAGIKSNSEWTFENCLFDSLTETDYQNSFSVHGSNVDQTGENTVKFINCRFKGGATTNNSLILSTLMNYTKGYQNYCILHGCEADGRLILREENASEYGAGIAWWATGFATTFTDEIISNTDSEDYTDHIDII